jgi:hypothetical protein
MKNKKLDEFLYKNRLKSSDLVEFWGVTKGVVSQILNGTTKLPTKRLEELLNNSHGWDTSMLVDQPEAPAPEQSASNNSLLEYLQRKIAELESKVDKLNEEKADLLQENAVLRYENSMLTPRKGDAEDVASSLSASAV